MFNGFTEGFIMIYGTITPLFWDINFSEISLEYLRI